MLAPDVATVLPIDERAIGAALTELRAGRPVAFPTETVYGLGADATDSEAVARVFELKGRPRDHPVIVHLASGDWLPAYADLSEPLPARRAKTLAGRFWPGPLTLVLPAGADVGTGVTGGQATVALRVPASEPALRLLAAFGRGLVAPSANRFGRVSPTTAAHVAAEFPGPLLVLDGGACEIGIESTIVDLTAETPRVLRPGAITADELAAALGETVALAGRSGTRPRADSVRVPGSLERHYAPAAETRLVDTSEAISASAEPGVAVLAPGIAAPRGFAGRWLSLPATPGAYGQGLYAALRELDAAGPSAILIVAVPDEPAWAAVADRLARAGSGTSRLREPVMEVVDE